MKNIESDLVWLLLVCVLLPGCENQGARNAATGDQKIRQEQLAQQKAKRAEIISTLKQAQNADDTWDQGLRMSTWTVDLQDRMLGKPIVSSGILVDVWLGKDGKHYLHLIKENVVTSF
jgi:hypothetical protein